MIHVIYHLCYDGDREDRLDLQDDFNLELYASARYVPVAAVDVLDVDAAFAYAQHACFSNTRVDDDWTRGPQSTGFQPSARSTSIGDVIQDPHGRFHFVERTGTRIVDAPRVS